MRTLIIQITKQDRLLTEIKTSKRKFDMKNFTLIPLHPVALYKSDLLELQQLFRENLDPEKTEFDITVDLDNEQSGKHYSSLDEVFQQNVPNITKEFVMIANEKDDDGNIVRGMRTTLTKSLVSYRYFAEDDKAWHEKTGKKMSAFFKSKKPWYWAFSMGIVQLSVVSMLAALFSWPFLSKVDSSYTSSLPIVLVAMAFVLLLLGLTGKVFPTRKVHLVPRQEAKKGFEAPTLAVILTTISSVAWGAMSAA